LADYGRWPIGFQNNKFRSSMEKTRITIVAITGIVLFFLANYLCRFLLGFSGLLASLIIAAAIAEARI